jgi:nitroreductase
MPHARPSERSGARIGVLTYHRSVNDGSIMQAYSLYHLLAAEFPDAQIEIIDYIPASLHRRHKRLTLYAGRPPFFNPRYAWTYRDQQRFLRQHCRYSHARLISDDLEEAQRFIESLRYDAIVVGSDTAWELERDPPPPNAYFRPARRTPTVAFAVSADPVPADLTPWSARVASLREALEAFQVITVRDEATRDFLQSLDIAPSRIGYLPDPTILWDFSEHAAGQNGFASSTRPLAALAAMPGLARLLVPHLQEAGFDVVSLMGSRQLPGVASLPLFSTIRQRLGLYRKFDAVITDRFHMTIFGLKHGRGAVVFLEDADRWPQPNSKGRDLLTRLGLAEMVWRVDQRRASPDQLHARLAAWPQVSRGLPQRIAALRDDARASGYSGIVPALETLIASQRLRAGHDPSPVGQRRRSLLGTLKAGVLGSEIRPTPLRTVLKIVRSSKRAAGDYLYDAVRYFRFSSTFFYSTRDNLAARITATYHAVERGLALPDPQPGFGARNIGYLIAAIDEYIRRYGMDESLGSSAGALEAYAAFNESHNLTDYPHRNAIERLLGRLQPIRTENAGGTLELSRESICKATASVTPDFFFTRHSIRQFSDENVSPAAIDAAIAIAQTAPAVCNRQECRVYVIHDKKLILDALDIQGSRGFNDRVNKLLVITHRLTAFYGPWERNQCWIDGGLFAMSLVLGLHAQGLGTCCLNWSKSAPADRAMRTLLKIPEPEVIIMLMAVGHIPPTLKVARSARPPLATACRHIYDASNLDR